jgi:putative ABC transport system permease protein
LVICPPLATFELNRTAVSHTGSITDNVITEERIINSGYLHTLGLTLLQGRDITAGDNALSQPVLLVNRAMAQRIFPSGGALDQQIGLEEAGGKWSWHTVVGIVADSHPFGPIGPSAPEIYVPFAQLDSSELRFLLKSYPLTLVVRQKNGDDRMRHQVTAEIRSVDANVPVTWSGMQARIDDQLSQSRFQTFLLFLFAAIAAILAVSGVYSLLSYFVEQRTFEIGMRLALGAPVSHIGQRIIGQAVRMGLEGSLLGILLSAVFARLMRNLLFRVSVIDVGIYVSLWALVVASCLVAALAPLARALKLSPMQIIRTS